MNKWNGWECLKYYGIAGNLERNQKNKIAVSEGMV
jgi:hypothetical protein